jgi:ATP-dependent DNA helicase DinG
MTPADLDLPHKAWRDGQVELLSQLAGIDSKYTLLQAPTGTGKSLMAVALAKLLGVKQTVILVATKQLQEQYAQEFGFIEKGMGRNNFPCLIQPTQADKAPCAYGAKCEFKKPDWGAPCEYYEQLYRADGAEFAVLNYAYWLTLANYTEDYFGWRPLVIADEAHTIEDEVRKFCTVSITWRTLEHYGLEPPADPEEPSSWITWAAGVRSPHIWSSLGGDKLLKDRFKRGLDWLIKQADPEKWVVSQSTYGFELKPVWVSPMMQELVWDHGDRWLMMSATILDAEMFASQTGVPSDETTYVEAPCRFDKRARPIWYWPAGKVSFKNPDTVGQVVAHVAAILEKYPTQSGLIHTSSYKLAQEIMDGIKSDRLITHKTRDRLEKIEAFRHTPGAVLVSPSVTTGVDLPYDACRFQIIAKIPFPDRSDPQLAKRMKLLPDGSKNPHGSQWYNWVTLCTMIQAYGRGMRAEDDACDTWLLDGNWSWFRRAVVGMTPDWVREAIRRYEEPEVDYFQKMMAESRAEIARLTS